MLWATAAFNILVETGALLLLIFCTFGRVLLVYVLPSLGSRLTYIVESNLPGMLSSGIFLLVMGMFCVLALGGCLASPRWGLIATISGPTLVIILWIYLSRYWFSATLVLHQQVRAVCRNAVKRGDGGAATATRRSVPHSRPRIATDDEPRFSELTPFEA